jgi:putative transposase
MSTVLRVGGKNQVQFVSRRQAGSLAKDLGTEVALIQALIPLGLEAVHDVLRREVEELAGMRYARAGGRPGHVRWSKERGSVYLSDQKLPIVYQRVRDQLRDVEVPLETYQRFQQPRALDTGLLRRVLLGLSCRRYAECAEAVPEAFGLAPSTVSRRYIRASARQLQALSERRLDGYDVVALLLDGKTFAEDELVIALGVTLHGQKVILGFVQTATENTRVVAEFLRELLGRGLRSEQGLLVVIDGSKGLRRGVQGVFGEAAAVQRCTWHKRENVVAHLPIGQQADWRRKLQRAYEQPTHAEAKAALDRLARELRVVNESAARSLAEGLEETLTLHRLGVAGELGRTFKTTNALESVMAQVEQRTGKVDRWRTSDQKQRWLASALLDIEPRLRRIRGYRALPKLREALQRMLRKEVPAA